MPEPVNPRASETSVDGTYTAPLGLVARLGTPELKLDLVPVLDLIALAMLFGLLFTRFVAMPGVRVELPRTDLRMRAAASDVAILTVGNRGALYFDGAIYDRSTIRGALQRYREERPARSTALLLKAQSGIDIQLFLDLCEMARESGYPQVQIIAERAVTDPEMIPDDAGASLAPNGFR